MEQWKEILSVKTLDYLIWGHSSIAKQFHNVCHILGVFRGDPKEFGVAVVSASKLSSRYSRADSTLDTHTLRHDSSCWSWSSVCVCVFAQRGLAWACIVGPTIQLSSVQYATIQGPAHNAIADALVQIISVWVGLYKLLGTKMNVKWPTISYYCL